MNFNGFARVASGALRVSSNPIEGLFNGVAYDSNLAVVLTAGAATDYPNGVPTDALGAMKVVDKAAAVAPLNQQNGLQFDSAGSLVTVDVAAATAPLSEQAQLQFDASGALVTSA